MELARPAQPSDMAAVTDLLRSALDIVQTQRGGATLVGLRTADDLVAEWLAESAHTSIFVGEFHHAVVGLAAVSAQRRTGATTLTGQIRCCYVEPEARGVGVGSALMEAMVAWSRERSCADMDALALPGDRASKQRLEASGFVARLLTLSRQLD